MAGDALVVADYGGGNLGSLLAALDRRSARYTVTSDADVVAGAGAVILPGDGAFAAVMDGLHARGLDTAVREVIAADRPFLGICVGMQILYEGSDEFGGSAGLGILPGVVRRFVDAPRVPHMGWNDLTIERDHPFVVGIAHGAYAYFLHSYRVVPDAVTLATASYGERFAAIAGRGKLVATQFHPEKSRTTGARLLDNFLSMTNEPALGGAVTPL